MTSVHGDKLEDRPTVRLCTFEIRTHLGRCRRLGLFLADGVLDINFATAWRLAAEGVLNPHQLANALVPSGMLLFISLGERALAEARLTIDRWKESKPDGGPGGETLLYARDEVHFTTPLPDPRSIRDFYAFEEHVRKGFAKRDEPVPKEWYELPVYYKTAAHNLLGPEADVNWPSFTQRFDFELELAAVIGRAGRDIKAANASPYIFGYTIMNDFSARDIQRREMKVRLGPAKGKDWATALGPVIVTADEIPDPHNLAMSARINGEFWSSGNSKDMFWSFEQMIEFLTEDDFIQPGDIIGSGTVGTGCGLELDRWVQRGDVMELEVEHIGVLRNRVR
ncbi:MAG TPA: fumarylacetoacetate hydrolase family protein [Bryobacteraceae bacterium]|nr:fumarylacetoacetate hydrolase family protein [Bryobacteraceae bacterium]